ncbi:hypothetical protein SCM10_15685 [Legionella pneumophila serogroup 1]
MKMTSKKNKKISQVVQVSKKKVPTQINLAEDDTGQIVWSFSLADNNGKWGFKQLTEDQLHNLIFEELVSKESLNWNDLKTSKSHNILKSKIIKEAQSRLEELNMDDLDEIFSLRLNGKKRLWGIRQANVLRVLWWDPHHEICPANKKHT